MKYIALLALIGASSAISMKEAPKHLSQKKSSDAFDCQQDTCYKDEGFYYSTTDNARCANGSETLCTSPHPSSSVDVKFLQLEAEVKADCIEHKCYLRDGRYLQVNGDSQCSNGSPQICTAQPPSIIGLSL